MAFLDENGLAYFKSKLDIQTAAQLALKLDSSGYSPSDEGKALVIQNDGTLAPSSSGGDLSAKADKSDTVLNTTLSRGRTDGSNVGTGSFAFGNDVSAQSNYSHAEGISTIAGQKTGNTSGIPVANHAEGYMTVSGKTVDTSERTSRGIPTPNDKATGSYAFIYGSYTHAEGSNTLAGGTASHAEGLSTWSNGAYSHAEGAYNVACSVCSHAEGNNTLANGVASHTEGDNTVASLYAMHASGVANVIPARYPDWQANTSYVVGDLVTYPATRGYNNVTSSTDNAKGYKCITANSDAEWTAAKWELLPSNGDVAFVVGNGTSNANRSDAFKVNWDGSTTMAGSLTLDGAISSGRNSSSAIGAYSFAVGTNVKATNVQAHAEGYGTTASGVASHAEGSGTTASGAQSHAEGNHTTASSNNAHAEGISTTASGDNSHAEGQNTTASANYAHAEGSYTTASGSQSHAEGNNTVANHRSQHVFGEYNTPDPATGNANTKGTYVEIVGNGVYENGSATTSNARTLDWSGNEVLSGALTTTEVNSSGTLYIQKDSGNLQIGKSGMTTSTTRDLYGFFKIYTTGGFQYAGIGTASTNVARSIWFNDDSLSGKPVINANFTYNPSNSHLSLGSSGALSAGLKASTSIGSGSIAFGNSLIASQDNMLVIGEYNVTPATGQVLVVGNGTADNARSNAMTLLDTGQVVFAGDVYSGITKLNGFTELFDGASAGQTAGYVTNLNTTNFTWTQLKSYRSGNVVTITGLVSCKTSISAETSMFNYSLQPTYVNFTSIYDSNYKHIAGASVRIATSTQLLSLAVTNALSANASFRFNLTYICS